MVPEARSAQNPPAWLVDWMRDAGLHEQCHSLVIDATCAINLHRLASAVAGYLNEFDDICGCAWRTFDCETLRTLAADPACRNILLAGSREDHDQPQGRPDLDRVVRSLARLGGVIIEGRCGVDATGDIRETFHVFLCNEGPRPPEHCHMWVNPHRFSPESLISVIADSFLDWSCYPRSLPRHHFDPDPHEGTVRNGPESIA